MAWHHHRTKKAGAIGGAAGRLFKPVHNRNGGQCEESGWKNVPTERLSLSTDKGSCLEDGIARLCVSYWPLRYGQSDIT